MSGRFLLFLFLVVLIKPAYADVLNPEPISDGFLMDLLQDRDCPGPACPGGRYNFREPPRDFQGSFDRPHSSSRNQELFEEYNTAIRLLREAQLEYRYAYDAAIYAREAAKLADTEAETASRNGVSTENFAKLAESARYSAWAASRQLEIVNKRLARAQERYGRVRRDLLRRGLIQ